MADVKKIATRDSYGKALAELGAQYENLVVLDADLAGATKTGTFKKAFPQRHINCGIAEANMVCVAAGMAARQAIRFIPVKSLCQTMLFISSWWVARASVIGTRLPVPTVHSHMVRRVLTVTASVPTTRVTSSLQVARVILNECNK